MKKKIMNIFAISMIIIFIVLFSVSIYNNIRFKNKISSLQSVIKKLESDRLSKEDCTFVKTLRVVNILDYEGTVLEDKFILVDSFQSFNPFVLKIKINNDIKEGFYYEFTFKGNKDMYTNNDSSLNRFEILNIKETNKEGLSQIQEECK